MIQELMRTIEGYLVGRLTVRDVETWLVARTRLIHESGAERAIQIANEMEADLIDLGEGIVAEATLRTRWDGYLSQLNTVVIEVAKSEVDTRISTSSSTIHDKHVVEPTVTLWLTPAPLA